MHDEPAGTGLSDVDNGEPLLEVRELHTQFSSARGPVRAVDGVSLTLKAGETLGVVGESGSGKSMLVRSIMGLLPVTGVARSGSVHYRGRDLLDLSPREMRRVWGAEMAMVPQDPLTSLNPVRRVGAQIAEPLRLHRRYGRSAARQEALRLMRTVGIPDEERRIREYPHQLSGGMRQRITIAAALACRPRILFADEPTTALDVTVQAQILDLLAELQRELKMAMVLVTHDLGVVATRADRVAVMYAGEIVEIAATETLFERMVMPYSEALFGAIPRLDHPRHSRLRVIPGRPPDLARPPAGCPFAPRCRYVQDKCLAEKPPLAPAAEPGHFFRCWFPVNAVHAAGNDRIPTQGGV